MNEKINSATILDRNFSFWAGHLRTINVDLAISTNYTPAVPEYQSEFKLE